MCIGPARNEIHLTLNLQYNIRSLLYAHHGSFRIIQLWKLVIIHGSKEIVYIFRKWLFLSIITIFLLIARAVKSPL